MAFARPTLQELITRVSGDFRSRLELTGALLRRSVVYVLARVVAGVAHLLHGHLEWVARQIHDDTCDDDILIRKAAMYGMSKIAAAFAAGNVTFTGVNGSVIPGRNGGAFGTGTILLRDDGIEYEVEVDATIAGGTVTVAVLCRTAGATGNADEETALALQAPIAGVNSDASVAVNGLTNGSDEETTEAFRARYIERKQSQPTGGSPDDYRIWTKQVSQVTRVWVYQLELGAQNVTIRFVVDNHPSSIIPDAPKVAEVQAYIDARKPVTAVPTVVAPIAVPQAFTIAITPDTAAIRAAIIAELDDLYKRDAEPGGTIYFSRLNEAVSAAEGEFDHEITVPAADVNHTTGQIGTRGAVTWA